MFLMAILSAVVAHAEPCAYTAPTISGLIDALNITPVEYTNDRLILKVSGLPECREGFKIEATINEASVHELVPAAGAVLSAASRLDGDRLTVQLTGGAALRTRLDREWRQVRHLRRFVEGVTLRWFANYSAQVVLDAPLTLEAMRRDCRPGFNAIMTCDPFAQWPYSTVPTCLKYGGQASRLRSSVTVEDPFVADRNARVRIRSVTRDLCGGLYAPETPWLEGVADQLIFGQPEAYGRMTVSTPSLIEVQGDISW